MADPAPAGAPEEQMANLHLDEVTGERVSKSELKKRQKQRMKDEEKKKKEAAAPPKPAAPKKTNAEAEEKELNPNVRIYSRPHCCIHVLMMGQ
jgi:lysyl-tRNA synthetase class 2